MPQGNIDTGHRSPTIRRPPPDYTQRSVKLRLFMYVALLMLVLTVIERARDPQAWKWLWAMEQQTEDARVDNRLREPSVAPGRDPSETLVVADKPPIQTATNSSTLDPVERAWEQGWADVLARLPADQKSLLFHQLQAAASGREIPQAGAEKVADLAEQLRAAWGSYQSAAFQSLSELKADDQASWIDVLRQVNARFADEVRPALAALSAVEGVSKEQKVCLARLEALVVRLDMAQIQDDTIFRPAERDIWFYEIERVRELSQDELRQASLGKVAYLQLFKQPGAYRGKVVTVVGTVMLAYRVAAPPNDFGLKEYFVYWLYPAGGPSSPLVVYAQQAPPGFPTIKDKDRDRATTKLHEDVEVTGVFVKRWAYAGRDGMFTAPLIVANVPQWRRPAEVASAAPRMATKEFAILTVAALLLATCVTAVLWKRAGNSRRALEKEPSSNLLPVGSLTIGPSTQEALRLLEQTAGRSEKR